MSNASFDLEAWAREYRELQQPLSDAFEVARRRTPTVKDRRGQQWMSRFLWNSAARVRKAGGKVDRVSAVQIQRLYEQHGGRCWVPECGEQAVEWGHIVPVRDGGPHALSNFRPACARHNPRGPARRSEWRECTEHGTLFGRDDSCPTCDMTNLRWSKPKT